MGKKYLGKINRVWKLMSCGCGGVEVLGLVV